jgi:hypothetical protein
MMPIQRRKKERNSGHDSTVKIDNSIQTRHPGTSTRMGEEDTDFLCAGAGANTAGIGLGIRITLLSQAAYCVKCYS